jgi:hypothetical protein
MNQSYISNDHVLRYSLNVSTFRILLLSSWASVERLVVKRGQGKRPPKPAAELMDSRILASQRTKAKKLIFHMPSLVDHSAEKTILFPRPRREIAQPKILQMDLTAVICKWFRPLRDFGFHHEKRCFSARKGDRAM